MNIRKGKSGFMRWLLLPAAVAISWPAAFVDAQEVAQGPLEEIVVTGSRIRQSPLDQKAPVLTISKEDLKRSGLADVGTYLQRLSISGSPLNTKFNSSGNFGFPPDGGGIGAGATQVDLRYLGCKRVLVLVDGMRWINGASASGVSSCVDLNTIPMTIIERIEILEDGASPIYGSDAITGVVNIITKDEFDGIEVSAYAGVFDEGDGNTQEYSIAMGNSDDDSSSFFSFTYYNQDKVKASNRSQANFPKPGTGVTRGSSGTPQGRFFFEDPRTGITNDVTLNNGVVNDGNPLPNYDLNNPGSGDFHDFSCTGANDPNCDRFNFATFNYVLTPSERWNIYGQGTRALTPDINAYLRGSYTKRQSQNQAAPEPIFIGSDAGTGGLPDTINVDASNPFNPFGITLDASSMVYFIGRRPLEGGPRVFDQDVNTWSVTGGFEGAFSALDREFFWDFNGNWSQNEADQIKHGGYNAAKMQQALGPVGLCVAPCVPLNLFGGQGAMGEGSITSAMLGYIGFVQKDKSEQELVVISGNISSSIVDLPAGNLAFAAGFEHREEDGFFQPDSVVVAGDSMGVPSSPTSGGFDVDEFYVEFRADLLSDRPFADQLDIQVAARNSDYDTFGDDTTLAYGLNYRPVETFLIRYNYAEGFRAPGIGELFGSVSRFDADLSDPCSNLNAVADQNVVNNCIDQGVPANGSYVQFNPQISVSTGGNSLLKPEESDTTTVSLVWSPNAVDNYDWVDGFSTEVLFYDIELDDAIQAVDAQTQLDQCAATNDPALCGGISRTGSGVINGFSNQLSNIGGIDTNGYDINLAYTSPETSWGTFKLSWFNTFVDEFKEKGITGSRKLEGIEENDSSIPEWKSTFITDWYMGDFGASWTIRHIDEVTESCSDSSDNTANSFTALGLCSNPNMADETMSTNDLDATTYHDVQFIWRPQNLVEGLEFTVGIQNLFDEDPPKCVSCSLNGYDAATHDAPGQFGYIRAVMSFE